MKKNQAWTNLKVAHLLRSVAAAYILEKGDFRFQSIAYQRAADAVEHSTSELIDLWQEEKLKEVPGIGPGIASHLDDLFRKGRSRHFDSLLGKYPEAIFELMNIPGIGAKSAFKLAKTLGITKAHGAVEKLEEAAKKGRIRKIEGFGEDSQSKIIQAITEIKSRTRRLLLPIAAGIAEGVLEWLRKHPATIRAESLGSLRRRAATVGDIDIAVATTNPKAVIKHFVAYPKKSRVIEAGQTSASIIIGSEVQIDLYLQPPQSYGSLLQHLTGSKHHNIALRTHALKIGYSLSEYGIVKAAKGKTLDIGSERGTGEWKHQQKGLRQYATEEEFYHFLRMDWIPPELREDNGEIQAAIDHSLPKLVDMKSVKGDLQIHSNFPIEPSHDLGVDSMEDIVAVADYLGYEYIAFTEHNPSVNNHTSAQFIDLIKTKRDKIDKLNYSREKDKSIRVKKIFNSLEIDIRPDGSLGVPDEGLDLLDFALVSVHSSFKEESHEMTKRILRALSHPKAKIFAHPTTRLLNEREGIDLDWDQIFDFCLKNDKWLEINADPSRLDLPDTLVREAVKKGVKMTLGTDSHSKDMLPNIKFAVDVARRGWAGESDIINTLPLAKLLPLLPLAR
jgi:DNA polymerase (family 10)